MDRICREQQGPSINKTQLKGGGGGGGGGTYIFKVTLYKMLFKLYNSIIFTFKCVYIYLDSSHKNENVSFWVLNIGAQIHHYECSQIMRQSINT